MWKPDEIASSSDESFEEEISTSNSGKFDTATGTCKLKSVFDDIFADIQANIPTLELENSSEESDNDEEPVLYTRDAWPLSPNILLQTSSPSTKVNNSPAVSASDSGLFLASPDGHTTSSSSLSDCEQDSIEFLGSSPSLLPSTLQTKSVASISTQTTCTDKELSESQTSTGMAPIVKTSNQTIDQETVELRFDLLEHLNLSDYLERTNEVTVPPIFPPILSDSSSDDADDGISLMEELVRLSRKQKSNAAPEPVSPVDHHARGMPENKKNKKQDVGVMSGPTVSSRGVTASLDPSTPSRSTNTVFLDLRKQEEQNLPQRHQALPSSICRILGISHDEQSDLSSSSDEEDELQFWQEQRRKVKEASLSCALQNSGNRSHSAAKKQPTKQKSAVEEIKPYHKESTVKLDETVVQDISTEENTPKVIEIGKAMDGRGISNILEDVRLNQKNEQVVVKDLREVPVRQAWTASSVGCKDKPLNDAILSPADETKTATTQAPPEQEFCHSTVKEQTLHVPLLKESVIETINSKISTEQRDQSSHVHIEVKKELTSVVNEGLKKTSVRNKHVLTEEEKAKRQRLQKSLQNLKPRLSSHKHHPAAPCTPVLFHEEASYERHVLSLPSLNTNTSYLLMSAKLSSCGELAVIRQGARGVATPDTHCFSNLVTWLACLVSPSMNTTDYAEMCGAPFYVVGLQQAWHEGQLKLEIGICSRTTEKGEHWTISDGKGKAKNKTSNSFRHAVSKFLSTNSLHSVYARLSECTPCPLQHLAEISISKRNLSTLLTVNPDPDAMQRVFSAKPGFFWQSMEMDDAPTEEKTSARLCQGPEIQNTVMLMQYAVFHQPFCLLDVLIRVRSKALDIAGLRLVLQERETPLEEKPAHGSQVSTDISLLDKTCIESQIPLLVLALRGPRAISQWQDEVGPVDAKLAQRTDPKSLRALYSNGAKEDHFFWCPRNFQSAGTELARWFGGRVPESGVVNIGSSEPVVTFKEEYRANFGRGRNAKTQLLTSSLHNTCRPLPYFVTACTDTRVFFIVSPALPVKFLGRVMCVCFERGYCTQGIKRVHLNTNRLGGLGIAPEQLNVFCPKRVTQSESASPSPVASTVLLLRKENALHHTLAVVKSLVESLADISLSQSYFLSVPYSDSMLKQLGGDFSITPDLAAYSVDLLRHAFHSNPELEQVCVLTLLKEKASISAGSIVNQLLLDKASKELEKEKSNPECGFELLGLKLLTSLSMRQAKEFTPCKIGDSLWKKSLYTLTAGPALVLALRGVNAFARLHRFVDSHSDLSKSKHATDSVSFDMLMSCTPELACRQLSVIFFDRELFSDQSARQNLHLLPPPRRIINGVCSGSSESLNESDTFASSPNRKGRNRRVGFNKPSLKPSLSSVETLWYADMSVLQSLLEKPRVISTVCVLKPQTATKHLGKVLKRLGQEGFSVIGMKMTRFSSKEVSSLMVEKEGELERHVCHMTSGPVVALCLQRENAVGRLLEVLGPSDPRAARRQSQFFLRGSFGEDSIQNAFYGSETYQEAIRDIKLLFPEGVCCPPSIDLKAEEIPCLALDEIFSVTANRKLVELSTEEQSRVDSSPGMTLLPSSLLEINCLILLPQLLPSRSQPGRRSNISFAEIVEAFLTAGFHFIGLRMALLGVAEAADCAKLYSTCLPADWKPHQLAGQLSKSPCLAMAVLRDGAVTCYDTLCDSSPKLRTLAANSGKFMLAGKTLNEAKRMVECFFDSLAPNRKARIELNTP